MRFLLIGLQIHKSCAVDMMANCQKPDKLSNDNTKYTNVCKKQLNDRILIALYVYQIETSFISKYMRKRRHSKQMTAERRNNILQKLNTIAICSPSISKENVNT